MVHQATPVSRGFAQRPPRHIDLLSVLQRFLPYVSSSPTGVSRSSCCYPSSASCWISSFGFSEEFLDWLWKVKLIKSHVNCQFYLDSFFYWRQRVNISSNLFFRSHFMWGTSLSRRLRAVCLVIEIQPCQCTSVQLYWPSVCVRPFKGLSLQTKIL